MSLGWAALLLSLCAPAAQSTTTYEFTSDLVVNPAAYYPEGPQIVDEGVLVAEMPRNRIVLVNERQSKPVWHAEGCGPTSIKQIPTGGYWILCHRAHHVVRVDENFRTIRSFDRTLDGRRITWPNDASVDSAGNLYLSSSGLFDLHAPRDGRVVFIDINRNTAYDLVTGLRYTNGILLQQDRARLLVSEHLNRRILSFPLLAPGRLGAPSTFFDFKRAAPVKDGYEKSGPDGMAAFSNGDICVADYGNGRVLLISSTGHYLSATPVRYRFVTNMAIARDERFMFVVMTESNTSPDMHGVVERFKVSTRRKS